MKLIVGLGNPGMEYQFTPHNLGFLTIDRIANDCGVEVRNRQCRALTARTKAAGVELLGQESFETHIHTQLDVTVNRKALEVPAGIGIDSDANRIAALHTHDTTGEIHVESPQKSAKYTLDQFLTVWGMPASADGRCTFFNATAPCTVAVTSKDSGKVGLDVILKDLDTLTLTVTST